MSDYNTYYPENLESGSNYKLLSVKITALPEFTTSSVPNFDSSYFLICENNDVDVYKSKKIKFSSLLHYVSQSVEQIDSFDGHFRGVFEHSGSEGDSISGSFSGSSYGDMYGHFSGGADLSGSFTGEHYGDFIGYHSGSAYLSGSFIGFINSASYAKTSSYYAGNIIPSASYAISSSMSNYANLANIATSSLQAFKLVTSSVENTIVPMIIGSATLPVYFQDGKPVKCNIFLEGISSSYTFSSSYSEFADSSSYSFVSEQAHLAESSSYVAEAENSKYCNTASCANMIINDDDFTVGSSLYLKLANDNLYNNCNLMTEYDINYYSYVTFICPSDGYYTVIYNYLLTRVDVTSFDSSQVIIPDLLEQVGVNFNSIVYGQYNVHVTNDIIWDRTVLHTDGTQVIKKNSCRIDAVLMEKGKTYKFKVKFIPGTDLSNDSYGKFLRIAGFAQLNDLTDIWYQNTTFSNQERLGFHPELEIRKIGEQSVYERFINSYTS